MYSAKTYLELDIDIEGYIEEGCSGDYLTPPSPKQFIITKITHNGHDITNIIPEDQRDQHAADILEALS